MNFFAKVILGSVAVLLLAAAVVLLFRSREAGRVEALLREAAGWASEGDVEKVAALIHPDFNSEGWDAGEAAGVIRRELAPNRGGRKYELESIRVEVNGDDAHAHVRVRVKGGDLPVDVRWDAIVHLRKLDGAWRILGCLTESRER